MVVIVLSLSLSLSLSFRDVKLGQIINLFVTKRKILVVITVVLKDQRKRPRKTTGKILP